MSTRRRLTLPATLAGVTLGITLTVAAASCGDDDGSHTHYFCFDDGSDAGGVDAGGPRCPSGEVEPDTVCPPGCVLESFS
jgi:hypothetical protein